MRAAVGARTLTGMRRRGSLEAIVALACFAATLGLLAAGGFGAPSSDARDLDGFGVALAALASLPLWRFERSPLISAGIVVAATVAAIALLYPLDAPIGAVAATYRLAAAPEPVRGPGARRVGLLLSGALVPAVAGALALRGHDVGGLAPDLLFWVLIVAGAWVAGDRSRLRRAHVADLEDRLARSERELERDRRLAVAEERTRIARELHDSAGHAINVILVQAGAARLLRERDGARSEAAIATIEEVARATIAEIDHLVHALREPGELDPPAPAHPTALGELLARYRAAGLDVQATFDQPARPVPASIAAAAYRILQEALTNAARHGAGGAEIAVRFHDPALTLSVVNPIVAETDDGDGGRERGGLGLIGMRERASLLGGTLEAHARDGHFHLHARLPYGDAAA